MSEPSPTLRDRVIFAGTCALMWGFFCFICSYSSTLLDDWYQVIYWQRHPFTLGSLWHNAWYNYNHYNPRIGENILLLVNGPRWIYLLATPTVEMLVIATMFAIVFRRWPRATARDALRIFVTFVVLWIAMPVPGIMWFYRPFNTNYVYGFEFTLLVFVPYYFELFRPQLTYRSRVLAPALFVLALCAGLTNEHTGPTAILALGLVIWFLWKKHHQVRAWMVAGFAGLAIGYPLLYFAPGQSERYSGIANRMGPMDFLISRGVGGALQILRSFVWEGQLALYIIAGAVLIAYKKRPGETPPRLDTSQLVTMAILTGAAFLIVVTLFVSPSWGERLFYASAVLFTITLLIVIDAMMEIRAARRFIVWVCLVLAVYHAIRLCMIYPTEYRENQERLERMRDTAPAGVASITPYTYGRTPWMNADDFGYASLREEVAHEAFGLSGIEYDRATRAEPSAPYKIELDYQFDPPVSRAEVEQTVEFPLSFVPSYVDRDIQFIRRIAPQLRDKFPGHHFLGVIGHVVGFDLPELKGRPLIALRYRADADRFDMIDVRSQTEYDALGRNYWLVWGQSLPKDVDESYLVACGTTQHAPLVDDPDGHGWRIIISYDCRGRYTQVLCGPHECWLGGIGFR